MPLILNAEDAPYVDARFTPIAELGRGSAGIVYRAQDNTSGELVALKILHSANDEGRAFIDEAELLRGVVHPNVVRVLASGSLPTGQAWLAMEWLEGETLDQRLKRVPLELLESLLLAARLADGVHAAHEVGVLHRDIKPANVFLRYEADGSPFPKLLDFGAATQLGGTPLAESAIVGTPAYMAPEQIRGDAAADKRSDIYGIGATLYELLTGQPPHTGSTHLATLARLATTPPKRVSELAPHVPREVDHYLASLLASNPAHRPESADAVAVTLRDLAERMGRLSLADNEPRSARHLLASRMVTTLVALEFKSPQARQSGLEHLLARGVDAVPLAQDALIAHFGAERALGSEAVSAVRLGRRLARHGARVGVGTGRAQVSSRLSHSPPEASGEVVDRAMELAQRGQDHQVLVDDATRTLCRSTYAFFETDKDVHRLQQRANDTPIGLKPATPFVGRDAELARIRTAFERARQAHRSILLSLSGPPGIGKTRTQREALHRLDALAAVRQVVHQHNEAYGQRRALGCAMDIVRGLLRLPKGANEEACRLSLGSLLPPEQLEQSQVAAFCTLVEGSPPGQGARSDDYRDAIWLLLNRVVAAALNRGTLLLVIEDLQWADPESVAWLEHVLSRFEDHELWVIVTARPVLWEHRAKRFSSPWHVRIDLEPLSNQAAQSIAAAVVGEDIQPVALARIVRQAAGSPLYAEELSRMIAAGQNIQLAPTIEAAIQASLDSLGELERLTLACASVFGNVAWDRGIAALSGADAGPALTALSQAGFVTERAQSRFSALREWQFSQGLVREVAYASLPPEDRRLLHARAASWLDSVGEDASIVAGHWDLAGAPEEAASYWERAARRALATSALTDALSLAERSLAFAPDGEVAFERARLWDEAWNRHDARASDRESAIIAMEQNCFDAASRLYARGARARYDAARGEGQTIDERLAAIISEAETLQLHDEMVSCAAELARRQVFAGRFAEGEERARQLLLLSREHGMRAAAVDAWQVFAIIRQSQGALSPALEARRSAVRAAQDAGLREQESVLRANLGFALSTVGARSESRMLLDNSLHQADEIGSIGARRHALMLLLCWAATYGSDRALNATLAETREQADNAADGRWVAPARETLGIVFYRGVELLTSNDESQRARALALLKHAATGYRASGNRDVLPVALGMWARAELAQGNPGRALSLAQEAVALLAADGHSLLNESTIFITLRDVWTNLRNENGARHAVEAGMVPLLRRTLGLAQTEYVRAFLTELDDNAQLVAAGERYDILPPRIRALLEDRSY